MEMNCYSGFNFDDEDGTCPRCWACWSFSAGVYLLIQPTSPSHHIFNEIALLDKGTPEDKVRANPEQCQ